jgi:hypothetical protein
MMAINLDKNKSIKCLCKNKYCFNFLKKFLILIFAKIAKKIFISLKIINKIILCFSILNLYDL